MYNFTLEMNLVVNNLHKEGFTSLKSINKQSLALRIISFPLAELMKATARPIWTVHALGLLYFYTSSLCLQQSVDAGSWRAIVSTLTVTSWCSFNGRDQGQVLQVDLKQFALW